MFRDRGVDPEQPQPANAEDIKQDLELNTILDAMAAGDEYLREQAERPLLTSLTDPDEILYRLDVLRDCLRHPEVVRGLYALAVDALESRQRARVFWFRDTPEALVQKSRRILELLVESLEQLREVAEEQQTTFTSSGFTTLFARLVEQLDDQYLSTVDYHLRELAFRRGPLISAELGRGNRSTDYVLRKPNERHLLEKLTDRQASYSFTVPARDEGGMEALGELRNRGLVGVADALAQSADHILGFFAALRAELGFYVGCLNLYEQLQTRGQPTCFPVPLAAQTEAFTAQGLYDASLAFYRDHVVGNDVDADGKQLVMITGANQGGKSTFLRSVGLAQLMLQAGMFVAADGLRANVVHAVFTHFKRAEDASMTSGKLDEELSRMSAIADLISPSCLLLCNESFGATNEREGSELGRQVIRAMVEQNVKVFFVTHLFDLADSVHRQQLESALFLRAERGANGSRTFRLTEGQPLPTSYGQDSYRRVFGSRTESAPAASA